MTPEQARAAIGSVYPGLVSTGHNLTGFDGVAFDGTGYAQLMIAAPGGHTVGVQFLIAEPLDLVALVAEAERQIRSTLRQFEGGYGRGFNNAGRGALEVGGRGYSANDGWV